MRKAPDFSPLVCGWIVRRYEVIPVTTLREHPALIKMSASRLKRTSIGLCFTEIKIPAEALTLYQRKCIRSLRCNLSPAIKFSISEPIKAMPVGMIASVTDSVCPLRSGSRLDCSVSFFLFLSPALPGNTRFNLYEINKV